MCLCLFIVVRPTRLTGCAFSGYVCVVNQPKASLVGTDTTNVHRPDIRPLGWTEDISNALLTIKEEVMYITRTFCTPVFGFQHNAKHLDDFLYNTRKRNTG